MRRLTKWRPFINRIDYGDEADYFDLCSLHASAFLRNDDDHESRRLRQIAYLARYARIVSHPDALDDMTLATLREWVKVVGAIVSEENALSSKNER